MFSRFSFLLCSLLIGSCFSWSVPASAQALEASVTTRRLFGFVETSVGADGFQPWTDGLSVSIPPQANPKILKSLTLEPATTELNIEISGQTAHVQFLSGLEKDQVYTLGVAVNGVCPWSVELTSCEVLQTQWLYRLEFRTTSNSAYPLGNSAEGRPIWAHTFGRCRDENCQKIMLTGAVHGNEWRSGDLGRLIGILETTPAYLAGQNKELLIIPQVNPDGVALNSRFTPSGVNLNRNFPIGWNLCGECGVGPASEVETQLVIAATEAFEPDYLLSYHAQWPPEGIIFRGDDTNPETIAFAEYVSGHTGYPVGQFLSDGDVPGDQTVWAESRGIRSLIIEATSTASTDWDQNWPLYANLLSPNF